MPINTQVSEQYQGVVESAGNPQNSTVGVVIQDFESTSSISSASSSNSSVSKYGVDLYASDGTRIAKINAPVSLSKSSLLTARKGLANVAAGKAPFKIACIGDSTTAGLWANGSSSWAGNKPLSYPTALATAINKRLGLVTNIDSVCGDNSTVGHAGTVPSFDTKVTWGANWGAGGAASTAGGQMIYSSAGAVGTLAQELFTFQPTLAYDTIEIWYLRNAGLGTFTVDNGGAVLGTSTVGGPAASIKMTISKALGTEIVNIRRTVAPTAAIEMIRCYNSASPQIEVFNMGWSGASTTNWNVGSGVYDPLTMITNYANDLHIINLGINDILQSFSPSLTYTNLLNIATRCKAVGDVLIVVPTPQAPAWNLLYLSLIQSCYKVAMALDVPVIDMSSRWVDQASVPYYINADSIHPLQIGYQDMANEIARFICT